MAITDRIGRNVSTSGGGIEATIQSGAIIDSTYADYTANVDITIAIPADDTIPQYNEGVEIMCVSISPKKDTNKLRVRFRGTAAPSSGTSLIVAAFANDDTDARAAAYVTQSNINFSTPITLEFEYAPGTTDMQTIHLRVGTGAGSTMRLNGNSSSRVLGGASRATLVVEEVVA